MDEVENLLVSVGEWMVMSGQVVLLLTELFHSLPSHPCLIDEPFAPPSKDTPPLSNPDDEMDAEALGGVVGEADAGDGEEPVVTGKSRPRRRRVDPTSAMNALTLRGGAVGDEWGGGGQGMRDGLDEWKAKVMSHLREYEWRLASLNHVLHGVARVCAAVGRRVGEMGGVDTAGEGVMGGGDAQGLSEEWRMKQWMGEIRRQGLEAAHYGVSVIVDSYYWSGEGKDEEVAYRERSKAVREYRERLKGFILIASVLCDRAME